MTKLREEKSERAPATKEDALRRPRKGGAEGAVAREPRSRSTATNA